MGIFDKKGPGFASSPVFGPIARKNPGARNAASATILDFGAYRHDGRFAKMEFSGGGHKASAVLRNDVSGLQVNLDAAAVSRPYAEAAARLVGDKIGSISREIKPNTARARAQAARSYANGKPWALARYRARPPGAANSTKLWNDSGTMRQDIRARLDATNAWAIVTPVEGVRNEFVVRALLRRDIPELRSASALKKSPEMKAAVGAVKDLVLSRPAKKTSAFGKTSMGGRAAEKISGSK